MKESDIRNPDAHRRYLEMVREDALAYFGDPSRLEHAPCPACGKEDFHEEFVKFGFAYVTCCQCATLYVNPRPKLGHLKNFYVESPSSRYWVESFFKPVAEARREKLFRPQAKWVAGLLPQAAEGMVGDVGAGFGIFLEELHCLWPQAKLVAVEPSPEMAQICRGKGFIVEETIIEDLAGYRGKFALLTAFEILEHLHAPRLLVQKVFELLQPGGCFLVTTLNGEGFDIQVLWEKSKSVFPPHHLNFMNPSSLVRLLEKVGFIVEKTETPGKLDWDIVETVISRGEAEGERFWRLLARRGSAEAKADFQRWISGNLFSSHMRLLARKPDRCANKNIN